MVLCLHLVEGRFRVDLGKEPLSGVASGLAFGRMGLVHLLGHYAILWHCPAQFNGSHLRGFRRIGEAWIWLRGVRWER